MKLYKYLIISLSLMSFFSTADEKLATDSDVAVVIYDEFNHGGNALPITEDTPLLPENMDDQMRSFKVTAGYEVTFYSRPDFEGYSYEKHTFSTDASKFTKYQTGISSIRITCAPPDPCKGSSGNDSTEGNVLTGGTGDAVAAHLYEDTYYGGTRFDVKGDIASFPDEFDKEMSSFKIKSGYELRFYEEPDFRGSYYTRRTDVGDFGSASDKVRSVKIMKRPSPSAAEGVVAYLYDGKKFTGTKFTVTESVTDFPDSIDRKMSSYQIMPGYQVRFFLEPDFKGGYYTRTGSASDVGSMDNKIRSIRIMRGPNGSKPPTSEGK